MSGPTGSEGSEEQIRPSTPQEQPGGEAQAGSPAEGETPAAGGPPGGETPPQPETAGEAAERAAKPAKSRLTPIKTIVLVIAILAVLAAALEAWMWWAHRQTVLAVDGAFTEAQAGVGLYLKDLPPLIRGWPIRHQDDKAKTVTYTWRGIRAHHLQVEYAAGGFIKHWKSYWTFP